MIETYREEFEINEAEVQLRNNAIIEREEMYEGGEEDSMEVLMDDEEDELEDESNIPEGYDDNGFIN
jgi:hypothetical protein